MSAEQGQYLCEECGYDLTLTRWQLAWLRQYGNPIPRPVCPANPRTGKHRISEEQTMAYIHSLRAGLEAS